MKIINKNSEKNHNLESIYHLNMNGPISWRTADTDESIPVINNGVREPLTVYLLCPDGTSIKEDNYSGDGNFGGENIFELSAHWNCPELSTGIPCLDRKLGLEIEFGKYEKKYPIKIVENPRHQYDVLPASPLCEYQGFYYEEEIEEAEFEFEVESRISNVFESDFYYEMLEGLAEKVIRNLENDLGWEEIPEGKVYDVVHDYMSRIWSVI